MSRPSFLVICTDQQRADWLGCYGHPVLRTPNVDRIAARGTRFERFHVASPVCMPNRASMLTGRYPSLHGLRYNGCALPRAHRTFVGQLAEAGYDTAAIGKSHLQPFTPLPPMRAARVGDGEAWRDPMRAPYEEGPQNYEGPGRYEIGTPYYGYAHVDMVTGHGDRCGGHYGQWFREAAPDWRALHEEGAELPHGYACPQAHRTPVPEELYPTAYVRDRACEWLRGRAGRADPFFAFVGFPDPHHPFNPPGRYWDLYDPDAFEVRLPYEAHANPTPPMRWLRAAMEGGAGQLTPQTAMMRPHRELREAMALTAGMIAFVDDAVGAILGALGEAGLSDDTIVVFTSDHGDYMGDFDMLLKGALPFRGITRVPFIWSDPADPAPRVTDALGSAVDMAATILDRAGLAPFNGNQGVSLLGAARGGEGPRSEALIEYNDGGPRLGFEAPARVRALLSGRWRYTLYAGQDWGELYDLEADPDETRNLWDEPAHAATRARLAERLAHHLTAQMDESPASDRIA